MTGSVQDLFLRDSWDRAAGGPLYLKLKRHLEDAIRSGSVDAGQSLPSEREIAELGGVSRVTVRKAVQELVRDGFVVQRHGSGTAVAPRIERVEQSLSRLTSFTEDMARRGMKVRSEWLERGVFDASPEEMMALGIGSSSRVARISRLRIADDVPLAIERAAISTTYLPDPNEIGNSLYDHLDSLGNKPVRAVQRISAINLRASDAAVLECAEGTAGLNIERVSYSDTGRVIEFTRSIYRGDAYDFVAELQI